MHRTWAGALAAALILGLSLTSCGGDEGPLTKAELVRQAEAACKQLQTQTQRALQDAVKQQRARRPTPSERDRMLAQLYEDVGDSRREALEALRALTPPEALSTSYDRFLAARRDTVELMPTSAQALSGEDPQAEQRSKAEQRSRTLGRGLGIKGC